MNSIAQPADATGYLENLMRAGQDAVKQFDDALATAAGVRSEELASSGHLFLPFELIVDLQREYLKHVWFLWNAIFLETYSGGAHSDIALAKGDRRFKDASWREQPYYDLLKQTYLLGSRHCMSL
jgi:polyhydroxyalkanoate synthase